MVTAGTYRKRHILSTPEKLSLVHDRLLDLAGRYGWDLRAWAVLSNHYHFIALPPEEPENLQEMLRHLHSETARKLNQMDERSGRKVWYQYWDNLITYPASYLARLKYVHQNPMKHGATEDSQNYAWCSAAGFRAHARPEMRNAVEDMEAADVTVYDDF